MKEADSRRQGQLMWDKPAPGLKYIRQCVTPAMLRQIRRSKAPPLQGTGAA